MKLYTIFGENRDDVHDFYMANESHQSFVMYLSSEISFHCQSVRYFIIIDYLSNEKKNVTWKNVCSTCKWVTGFVLSRLTNDLKEKRKMIYQKREKNKNKKTLNYSMLTWLRTTNKVVDKFTYMLTQRNELRKKCFS